MDDKIISRQQYPLQADSSGTVLIDYEATNGLIDDSSNRTITMGNDETSLTEIVSSQQTPHQADSNNNRFIDDKATRLMEQGLTHQPPHQVDGSNRTVTMGDKRFRLAEKEPSQQSPHKADSNDTDSMDDKIISRQ